MAKKYPAHVRAQAVVARTLGESSRSIARRLGCSHLTIDNWYAHDAPQVQQRSQEALGDLIYDTLVVSLRAIHARAVATARPEWIEKQQADALARLDEVAWTQLMRVVSSLRPTTPGRALATAGQTPGEDDEDREDREDYATAAVGADGRGDGAVDPAA